MIPIRVLTPRAAMERQIACWANWTESASSDGLASDSTGRSSRHQDERVVFVTSYGHEHGNGRCGQRNSLLVQQHPSRLLSVMDPELAGNMHIVVGWSSQHLCFETAEHLP